MSGNINARELNKFVEKTDDRVYEKISQEDLTSDQHANIFIPAPRGVKCRAAFRLSVKPSKLSIVALHNSRHCTHDTIPAARHVPPRSRQTHDTQSQYTPTLCSTS